MQKLKRSINMGFRVTAEEQEAIRKRMEMAGISSLRVYLMKMALMGHIICLDMADVRECSRLLRTVSNNVNQIAKHSNQNGRIYTAEIDYIKERLDEVWQQQDKIIKSLTKVLEVV